MVDIPITRNCHSCSLNDDVIGCRLTGSLSPTRCVRNQFAYYIKGKQFFYCERCRTNSVISKITGFLENPPDARIIFWCENCNDFPMIEGEEYHGYRIKGITFVHKNRINSILINKNQE